MTTAHEKARQFLDRASEFQLGGLPTEARHPRTSQLSALARTSLPEAIRLLKSVELEALENAFPLRIASLETMALEIAATFREGGRVFLCGCGATGRLSLSLETLWRQAIDEGETCPGDVISFMAGGDYALVRSIENFEDHPEYGERQLRDLGFREGDLLISTTEGGETPFVIGATEAAAELSSRAPYFLFCNPEGLLRKTAERSRRVLDNPKIRSISLLTGPMALAGSTRLQATTALMLAVGTALFSVLEGRHVTDTIVEFETALRSADFEGLMPLIELESEIYLAGERCLHSTSRHAITVITDTTERSPTFSLVPFENRLDAAASLSWTYLHVPDSRDTAAAWRTLLRREPRPLEWPGFAEKFGREALLGFDFDRALERRSALGPLHVFTSRREGSELLLALAGRSAYLAAPRSLLAEHLLLKCALNICSTLVMGRAGRFESNVMLYVRSSNNKLVDRSIRYVQALLREAGVPHHGYDEICYALYEVLETLPQGEAAVPKVFERLRKAAS
jgi:N-acetylmuramic acid 6-phosphate etherase